MHSERTGQGYSEREKEGRKEGREGRRVGGKERQIRQERKDRQKRMKGREGCREGGKGDTKSSACAFSKENLKIRKDW